jgi:hypothetical protein
MAAELHLLLEDAYDVIAADGRRVSKPHVSVKFVGNAFRTRDKKIIDLVQATRAFRVGDIVTLQSVIEKRVEQESDKIVAQLKADPATKARVAAKLKAEVGAAAPQVA